MTNKETKQAIVGFTEFFKGITGNQDMKIPNDLAKKYGIEQEPCEDAISREKAKQFLYERLDRLNDNELYDIFSRIIDDMYNELPSITPTQRWIPVSERMPKIAGIYRVTRYYPNNVMNPNYLVDACCFDGSNTWYDDNRINYDRAYADNVIAWQENPEPYKVDPQEGAIRNEQVQI